MKAKEAWNGLLDDIKMMKHLTNIRQKKDILDKLDILRLVLVDYEEMKKEIIAHQETENSLTQWVADLTTELEELKKRDTKILELLVELLNKQMLGQEGLVLINRIKNLLSWSDKDE
jgi:hypothetical protein